MDFYVNQVLNIIFEDMSTTGKLGLLDGTLYDVLDSSYAGDDTAVSAVGFNISCGYLPAPKTTWDSTRNLWQFVFPEPYGTVELPAEPAGIIGLILGHRPNITVWNSVTMYSTGIHIVDTAGKFAPWVDIDPPMVMPSSLGTGNVSALQFFQCAQALVCQTAVVDIQSKEATAAKPEIAKRKSSWLPYSGPAPGNINGTMVNMWGRWFKTVPSIALAVPTTTELLQLSLPSMLKLLPDAGQQGVPLNVSLHSVENALSSLIALMFWTIGHETPGNTIRIENGTIANIPFDVSPFLLEGDAKVQQHVSQVRLHLNLVAILIGLCASISLALLSILFCRDQSGPHTGITGFGLLHIIWLFRNHPEPDGILPEVETPSDDSLRAAGMVPVKLIDSVASGGHFGVMKQWS
ncbi:hypothetical protein DFH09DRAFT_1331352 [Mycena vulgaris]|nr:hypothetical protein DFH09DRAFT_1331352 [Mycena vulgaris]